MQVQIRKAKTDIGASIILTPCKYNRGSRYVGTAILSNVVIKDEVCTGQLVGEYLDEFPLEKCEIPGPVMKRMKPLTTDVKSARVLYASGKSFFYLP